MYYQSLRPEPSSRGNTLQSVTLVMNGYVYFSNATCHTDFLTGAALLKFSLGFQENIYIIFAVTVVVCARLYTVRGQHTESVPAEELHRRGKRNFVLYTIRYVVKPTMTQATAQHLRI